MKFQRMELAQMSSGFYTELFKRWYGHNKCLPQTGYASIDIPLFFDNINDLFSAVMSDKRSDQVKIYNNEYRKSFIKGKLQKDLLVRTAENLRHKDRIIELYFQPERKYKDKAMIKFIERKGRIYGYEVLCPTDFLHTFYWSNKPTFNNSMFSALWGRTSELFHCETVMGFDRK